MWIYPSVFVKSRGPISINGCTYKTSQADATCSSGVKPSSLGIARSDVAAGIGFKLTGTAELGSTMTLSSSEIEELDKCYSPETANTIKPNAKQQWDIQSHPKSLLETMSRI
jgi:hypothetical protein